MTIDQARAEAASLWCQNAYNLPLAWRSPTTARCVVGYTDGDFRYAMGIGETWEDAVANAKSRKETQL